MLNLRYFQRGFNYSQDGPGNRLVYHLQGCNLFCPWCSNPEGMDTNGNCTVASVEDVVAEIISCNPMFFGGGGVTFTGGEASLQWEAVRDIMEKVGASGITTAIETNASTSGVLALAEVCDYWMIDFKHPDADKLSEITGGNARLIKDNIIKLSETKELHLRIPLIGGFNDDDGALAGFVEFFGILKDLGAKFDIELLPYHEYGKEKWQKLGLEYKVTNGFVSNQTVNKFKQVFKDNGFTVIKT